MTLSTETLENVLTLIDEGFTLEASTVEDRGRSRIHTLSAARTGDTEELIFKAAPEGEEDDAGIPADARLLALLSQETSIPVPEVLGIIDEHPDVPTPSFVMNVMGGEALPYETVGRLPDDVLGSIAGQVGSHLGELHRVDCIESYGHVTSESAAVQGGLPADPAEELVVTSGLDSWTEFLDRWLDRELQRHADSRFSDLTPALRSWASDRIEAYDDPYGPVLGRNDHGLHNLLVDREEGELTAMLDWAYTLGVAPAFDFEYAAYLFSGAFLAGLPGVEDRRELVRTEMTAGYRSTAASLAADVTAPHPLYEMLAMSRIMNDFELLDLPEGRTDQVATRVEADARALIEESR